MLDVQQFDIIEGLSALQLCEAVSDIAAGHRINEGRVERDRFEHAAGENQHRVAFDWRKGLAYFVVELFCEVVQVGPPVQTLVVPTAAAQLVAGVVLTDQDTHFRVDHEIVFECDHH